MPTHPVVEIENVSLDLVTGSVLWQVRHLQHAENCSGIAIAPFDERGQDRLQIGCVSGLMARLRCAFCSTVGKAVRHN